MNIKIKHMRSYKYLLLAAVISTSLFVVSSQQASAADAKKDAILALCEKNAPKAKKACPQGVQESRNIAAQKCKNSKKKGSCIRNAATGYIKKATAGKPSEQKFKNELDKILTKAGGDRTVAATPTAEEVNNASVFGSKEEKNPCGGGGQDGDNVVYTKFNFGCLGPGPDTPEDLSPIMDLLFSLIRFMSAGIGLVLVASIIWAGIQYSTSEGSPEATQAAKTRVRDAFIGLVIYIFAFSFMQFLIPGGVFN